MEQVLHILYEGDHTELLGEELPYPALDILTVEQRLVFLADDHPR